MVGKKLWGFPKLFALESPKPDRGRGRRILPRGGKIKTEGF